MTTNERSEMYRPAVGEGAIAIPTLADVPIGAVAVLFHHQHLPTSGEVHWLVVGKANGNVYVGLSSVFRETAKIKEWYWPKERFLK